MILDALKRMFGRPQPPEGIPCEEALRRLNEYLDGELETMSADQVESHFERCVNCYPHLRLEERFRERIRKAMRREECPDRVRERVLEALAAEES